jgi:hypothetical protein
MRRYLIIVLFPFLLYACTEAHYWENDIRIEETETKSFSSDRVKRVEVNTKNGAIETRAWDDDSIIVTFEKWTFGDDVGEAEDKLDEIKVFVSKNPGSGVLDIDVEYPVFQNANYGCNVWVDLPASIVLDLETSNGAITVLESESDFVCSTSNGAITTLDTEGKAELSTSNGIITVNGHYGELSGKTSNGIISADIVLPRQGTCVLKTSNGPITLSIPDSTSATMEASTSNGKIQIHGLDVSIIKMDKTEFKGKMRDGRGNIDLSTSNGSISVKSNSY